jgi:site-specific recombinase XerD
MSDDSAPALAGELLPPAARPAGDQTGHRVGDGQAPAGGGRPAPGGAALVTTEAVGGDPRVAELATQWLLGIRSTETRRAYGRDLGAYPLIRPGRYVSWLEFCRRSALHPLQAGRPHLDAWLQLLATLDLAQSSRARALASVASWYGWLVDEGHLPASPAGRVDRRRHQLVVDPDYSPTVGLDVDQVDALLRTADADTSAHAARDALIVALLYYLGLRVAELVGIDDADLGAGRGHRTVTITRKGGKRQRIPMPPPVCVRLDAYLAVRDRPAAATADVDELLPAPAGNGGRGVPLLRGEQGQRLAATTVRYRLRRLAQRAGLDIEGVLHPHRLRSSCVTNLLGARDGRRASLADVQDLVGHRDPRTTRRYDRRHDEDRSPVYLHPALGAAPRPATAAEAD